MYQEYNIIRLYFENTTILPVLGNLSNDALKFGKLRNIWRMLKSNTIYFLETRLNPLMLSSNNQVHNSLFKNQEDTYTLQ